MPPLLLAIFSARLAPYRRAHWHRIWQVLTQRIEQWKQLSMYVTGDSDIYYSTLLWRGRPPQPPSPIQTKCIFDAFLILWKIMNKNTSRKLWTFWDVNEIQVEKVCSQMSILFPTSPRPLQPKISSTTTNGITSVCWERTLKTVVWTWTRPWNVLGQRKHSVNGSDDDEKEYVIMVSIYWMLRWWSKHFVY